jgi:hypothetical protein
MRARGVRTILLKGPAVALWVYDADRPRAYGDTDLLVSPLDHATAEQVLVQLGFTKLIDDADTPGWRHPAHPWRRIDDGSEVDLHHTLVGVEATSEELWDALSERTMPMAVGGGEVEVLTPPARALHVALHAAQHGARTTQPLLDLERALDALPDEIWSDAARIADRVQATSAFATGLRLSPRGAALAERLCLPAHRSTETALLALTPPPAVLGWEHLARTRGWRALIVFVTRKLVPTPRLMRAWSPMARRGRLGLALAYLGRPLWVAVRAGPGFAIWLNAERGHADRARDRCEAS